MASSTKRDEKTGREETRAQRESEQVVNKAIEETKDTARRALQEAKKDIPEYTATFYDFQEQNIRAIREMTEDYLESQKEVANAIQSVLSYYGNGLGTAALGWNLPKRAAEMYVRWASNLADTTIAASKLSNDIMFASMEASRSSMQLTKDNVKEISKMNTNAAKVFEEASRMSRP
jgi:hypothetical protein